MRSLIIGLVVFLAACNGSTTEVQKVPYTDPQVTAKLDALTQALADATHAQAQQALSLRKLTLIGKIHGVSTSIRMQGEFRTEAIATTNFGPCTDMGVLVGFINPNSISSDDPLAAVAQAFKQCTGYSYEVNTADGSLAASHRVYFDGPNCSGNMFVWNASGASYNDQVLNDGVVFSYAGDGKAYMVVAGQTPNVITVQSVYIIANGGCSPDGDIQPMYVVTPNNVSITGVPDSGVGVFQLSAP